MDRAACGWARPAASGSEREKEDAARSVNEPRPLFAPRSLLLLEHDQRGPLRPLLGGERAGPLVRRVGLAQREGVPIQLVDALVDLGLASLVHRHVNFLGVL